MRTLVILVDGMRPDALENILPAQELLSRSAYTLNAQSVMPSVTLPCHMSLFHSVDPARHGTTTNTYAPQVRPIRGLCEILAGSGKKCAFFYNWEELRDLTRPGSLVFSFFCKGDVIGYDRANQIVTDAAIDYLKTSDTDFTFIYLGHTDMAGHQYGWMSDAYMQAVEDSWICIGRILDSLPEDYTVIVTADHGGHARTHGMDIPEDMTIPIIITGKTAVPGQTLENATIKDIAPTITALLGVPADPEWEGKSLL